MIQNTWVWENNKPNSYKELNDKTRRWIGIKEQLLKLYQIVIQKNNYCKLLHPQQIPDPSINISASQIRQIKYQNKTIYLYSINKHKFLLI